MTTGARPINYAFVRAPEFRSRIIINLAKGYLYCPIPKAANTAWKVVLADELPKELGAIHGKYAGFQYLASITPEQYARQQNSLFKFIFVRDPYSRLLSTYKNKFENVLAAHTPQSTTNAFWAGFARYMKQKITDAGQRETPDENITFSEFVHYICGIDYPQMDEHCHPQALLARPDKIDYDFIGRLERLPEDVAHVFKRLNITKTFPTQEQIRFPGTNASTMLDQYYTPKLKQMIREKFDMDFKQFGY